MSQPRTNPNLKSGYAWGPWKTSRVACFGALKFLRDHWMSGPFCGMEAPPPQKKKKILAPGGGWGQKKTKKKIGPFWGLETQKIRLLTIFYPRYVFFSRPDRIGSDRTGSVRIVQKTGVRGFSSFERASGASGRSVLRSGGVRYLRRSGVSVDRSAGGVRWWLRVGVVGGKGGTRRREHRKPGSLRAPPPGFDISL
jgi:hypothetical protein